MRVVKPMPKEDLDKFALIVGNAYPVFLLSSAAEKERFRKNMEQTYEDANRCIYGLYRDGVLLGGMVCYDFQLNMFSSMQPVGGVGMVAVDLIHKKEKVAKEMIEFFLDYYHEKGMSMTMLYPFRPDFYKKMGYGYGTKVNQYRFSPSSLPRGSSKDHIRYLTAEDKDATIACYNRIVERTHGMTYKPAFHWDNGFGNEKADIVGYVKDGRVEGYLIFGFEKGKNFLINDMIVNEMFYEHREALMELSTFLHGQLDQIRQIVLSSHDDTFQHLLFDPRNGSDNMINPISHESNLQAVGLMYRIIDVPAVFMAMGERDFGGQSCRLKITLTDTFFPRQAGGTVVHFENGRATVSASDEYEVEMRLDVSEFSSLLMGVVSFGKLYEFSLVELSDPSFLDLLDKLFFVKTKPICITRF